MVEPTACEACGTQVAPGLLICPGCQRLVHADRLRELAGAAGRAEEAGDPRAAAVAWREALELLPPGTRQYDQVSGRITELGRAATQAPARPAEATELPTADEASGWSGRAGLAGLGAIGLFLLKFKFAVLFLLTKAKFLMLGLTKASTFFSMLVSFGHLWTLYGWPLGLGLVLSIYVHEMGHVYLLTRYGIAASAPLFIPGFGALIRVKQQMPDVHQDARVGLAGPVWGMGAAVACLLGSFAFDAPVLSAVAKFGALINLFNLIPIWQLDGGRAFRALSRSQRWLATAALALAWTQNQVGLLVFLVMGGVYRAVSGDGPEEGDRSVLVEYIGLVGGLSALMMIAVGG